MVSVRAVRETDKEAWFGLDRHLSEAGFIEKVRTGRGYVLSENGSVVGIMRYELFWDSIPFCTLLYIDEGYGLKGCGRRLMEHWEADMKKRGYGMLLTSTRTDETSQHFYRKMGYKDCGGLVIDIPGYAQPMELFLAKAI